MKIAALVLLLIQSGNRAPAPEMQVWLCPVHADNQSGEPGSCPVCQRPLEQRTLVTAWLCPMHNHIRGEQGGACPVCGMGLARTSEQVLWICPRHAEVSEARPGICRIGGESLERGIAPLPHGDHNPRHGGQLFMAPDGFHHVEGALADSGEFHLYFYDNFTRPVDARRFGARVNDRRLQQAVDGGYAVLRSELPLRRPAELTVLVTFDTDREERFTRETGPAWSRLIGSLRRASTSFANSMRREIAVLMGIGLIGLVTRAAPHETATSRFTYNQHILPIFQRQCASCHRPGGAGPMSLLHYSEATPWARSIKMHLLDGQMPPWPPVEGVGEFLGARRLTPKEINMIVEWSSGGAPEGAPVAASGETPDGSGRNPDSWTFGPPDLILSPDAALVLGPDEIEAERCFDLAPAAGKERLVRAVDLQPATTEVARSAVISTGGCGSNGWPIATWLTGQTSSAAGGAVAALRPRAALSLRIYYRKGWRHDGKQVSDRPRVGLYFARNGPRIEGIEIGSGGFRLKQRRKLASLFPAKAGTVEVVFPDGRTRQIIVIEKYDPAWRIKYQLRTPIELPPGSLLRATDPPVWVDLVP